MPNAFLIGAAKNGTTTLTSYFRQHPEVYVSPIKEPHYFSSDIDPNSFQPTFRRTLEPLGESYWKKRPLQNKHQAFIRSRDQYESLFERGREYPIRLDASTSYLWSKVAPQRISEEISDPRIIVILRNPVDRAYSHYLMALRYGFVQGSFEEEWEKDVQRSPGIWGKDELFADLGDYGTQLERYYSRFPSERIKVLLQSSLIQQQDEVLEDLCRFLNVSIFVPDQLERENTAAIPRWKGVTPQSMGWMKGLADKVFPPMLKRSLKSVFLSEGDIPKMSPEMRSKLTRYYSDQIHRTQDLTNIDLTAWLKT